MKHITELLLLSLTEIKCDCITDRKPKYTGGKPIVTVNYCDKKSSSSILLSNVVVVGDSHQIIDSSWRFQVYLKCNLGDFSIFKALFSAQAHLALAG